MSIRDYLKRRLRIFFGIAILGWLMCAGSLFFLDTQRNCRPGCGSRSPPPAVSLGFPVFVVAIIGLTFFVRCPRCQGRLGTFAATLVTRGISRPINFCPYCGVNLDENYQLP